MKTVIVCCKTIERELALATTRTGVDYPVIWLESGLHNVPTQLNARLQHELDHLSKDIDRVLLGFGYCGNSIAGLKTGDFHLIVPRVDDCITLLLGSYQRRLQITKEEGTYFLTEGWLKGERNIWEEFLHARKRYGEKRAQQIFCSMLAHYSRLAVVDTGTCDLEQLLPTTEMIAAELGLRHQLLSGSLTLLERLLTGPWNDAAFLTVSPFSTITAQQLWLCE